MLPQLTPAQIAYEIDHNADLIEEVLGGSSHASSGRPTARSEDVRRHITSLHNEMWPWSIDHHYLVVDAEAVAQSS